MRMVTTLKRFLPCLVALFGLAVAGCNGEPCSKIGAQFGLSQGNLNTMARSFLIEQRSFPSGTCGANGTPYGPTSVASCIQTSDAIWPQVAGLVCATTSLTREHSATEQAPFTGQGTETYLRGVPYVSVRGRTSVKATVKSFCDVNLNHTHTLSDSEDKDADEYLRRIVVAEVDFELKAEGELQVSYGGATTTIDAGDSCNSKGFLFRGCTYLTDGKHCYEN